MGAGRRDRDRLSRRRHAVADRGRGHGDAPGAACAPTSPSRPDVEVTVECNPESVSRDKLAAYRAAGVTRISLGVQSLDDAVLPRLGRLHDARGARRAFEAARDGRVRQRQRRSHVRAAGSRRRGVDAERRGRPRLGARASLGVRPHARRGQPVGRHRGGGPAARGHGGRAVLGAGPRGGRARIRALRDLQLRPARLSLAPQPDLLARGRVPGGRSRGLWIRRRRAVRQREAGRTLLRHARGGRAADRDQRAADRSPAGQRASVPGPSPRRRRAAAPRSRRGPPTAPALARRIATWREAGLLADRGANVALTEAGFLVSDALFVDLL